MAVHVMRAHGYSYCHRTVISRNLRRANCSLHADGWAFADLRRAASVLCVVLLSGLGRCHQRMPAHCFKRLALARVVCKSRLGQTVRAPLLARCAYGSAGIHRRSGAVLPTGAILEKAPFPGEPGDDCTCEAASM